MGMTMAKKREGQGLYHNLVKELQVQDSEDFRRFFISDATTDVSNHSENVVVVGYLRDKTVVERFWSFSTLPQGDAYTISSRITTCLEEALPYLEDKQKHKARC